MAPAWSPDRPLLPLGKYGMPNRPTVSQSHAGQAERSAHVLSAKFDLRDLRKVKVVGKGSASVVYHGIWQSRFDVAIKESGVEKANSRKEFEREVAVLRHFHHPNLVRLIGATHTKSSNVIVTEYCYGGSLFDYLNPLTRGSQESKSPKLSVSQKLKVLMDVAKAVHFLHSATPPIMHRDLKSLNVLLKRPISDPKDVPTAKVADFGMCRLKARRNPSDYFTAMAGTFHWMAPEVLLHQPYTEKADVYSFGVVVWEVLAERVPYGNVQGSPVTIAIMVAKGLRPELSHVPAGTSLELRSLMQRCWDARPDRRPSFGEVVEALRSICRTMLSDLAKDRI